MLFTFPSRYWFTIDHKKYLALGHSRPGFRRDFTSPALLKNICYADTKVFIYRAITVSGGVFQPLQLTIDFYDCTSFVWETRAKSCNTQETYGPKAFWTFLGEPSPVLSLLGLGSSPFARHYSGNDYYFLFLRLLRCFSSPGLPPKP